MAVKLINGDESSSHEAASHFISPGLPAWSEGESKHSATTCSFCRITAFIKQKIRCNFCHGPFWDWIHISVYLLKVMHLCICVCIFTGAKNLCVCVCACADSCRPFVHSNPVKQQFPYPSNSQRSEAFRQRAVGWWRLAVHASDSIWGWFQFQSLPPSCLIITPTDSRIHSGPLAHTETTSDQQLAIVTLQNKFHCGLGGVFGARHNLLWLLRMIERGHNVNSIPLLALNVYSYSAFLIPTKLQYTRPVTGL